MTIPHLLLIILRPTLLLICQNHIRENNQKSASFNTSNTLSPWPPHKSLFGQPAWNKNLGKNFLLRISDLNENFFSDITVIFDALYIFKLCPNFAIVVIYYLKSNVPKEYFTQLILVQKWAIYHVGQANTAQPKGIKERG